MNGDIQAARKLLRELREAYQGLPRPSQLCVAQLLRESAIETQPFDMSDDMSSASRLKA
jgi:hypothetical protein